MFDLLETWLKEKILKDERTYWLLVTGIIGCRFKLGPLEGMGCRLDSRGLVSQG